MDSGDEIKAIFSKLSPDNQKHLLMLTRMAYVAECSVKQFLHVPIDEDFSHEILNGLCDRDTEPVVKQSLDPHKEERSENQSE